MPFAIIATPVATRQIAALRGARRKAYDKFELALALLGCAALGYRLTGDEPLSSLCVQHLRGSDRVVVAFSDHQAWILLVGPHVAGDQAADVYGTLYQIVGVPRPTEPRAKPPCCGDDAAPELGAAIVDGLVRQARALLR